MKWAQNHIAANGGSITTFNTPAPVTFTATGTTAPVGNFFASDQILAVLLRVEQAFLAGNTPHKRLEDVIEALAEAVRELSDRVDDLAHND